MANRSSGSCQLRAMRYYRSELRGKLQIRAWHFKDLQRSKTHQKLPLDLQSCQNSPTLFLIQQVHLVALLARLLQVLPALHLLCNGCQQRVMQQ